MLLKEGTDSSQGKGQLLSNISACLAIADTLSSTLGPRGMDKLIVNERGQAQITNDGATILKLLDIVHPAARTLVDMYFEMFEVYIDTKAIIRLLILHS